MEKIVRGDVGKICSIDALNLTDKLEKKLSKDEAQKVIKRLQQDRWLSDVRKQNLKLSQGLTYPFAWQPTASKITILASGFERSFLLYSI